MRPILNTILVVFLISCTSKKENTNSDNKKAVIEHEVSEKVALVNPCDLVSMDDIATAFGVDSATIESYTRNPYPDTNRCEFIWNDPNDATKGSQIMITISSNLEIKEMPSKFSNMLRMDLEKGVMGTKQQIIKPTPIDGFGTNGYHWTQPDFQNVQKIKYQVDEKYLVEVLFNAYKDVDASEIKNKLLKIGNTIKEKL